MLLNSINIPKVGNSKAMKLEEDILEQCIQQYVLEQFPTDGIEDDKIIKQLQERLKLIHTQMLFGAAGDMLELVTHLKDLNGNM